MKGGQHIGLTYFTHYNATLSQDIAKNTSLSLLILPNQLINSDEIHMALSLWKMFALRHINLLETIVVN